MFPKYAGALMISASSVDPLIGQIRKLSSRVCSLSRMHILISDALENGGLPLCLRVRGCSASNRSNFRRAPLLSRELEFESMLGSQTFWYELSLPVI
jgi:hypothetical protein